jgi:predicted nucleic acid-binding protein
LSGKLHSFESLSKDSCPKSIVLDTNFILNFTHKFTQIPRTNNVTDCLDFCKTLVYENCGIFIPQIVINEFCCQVYLNAIDEYRKRRGLKNKLLELYDYNPNSISAGHAQIRKAVANLDIIISKTTLKEDGKAIRESALKLMRKYNFLPSDAFIGALILENNIKNLATLDVYFAKNIIKEDGVNVYMPEILVASAK